MKTTAARLAALLDHAASHTTNPATREALADAERLVVAGYFADAAERLAAVDDVPTRLADELDALFAELV